MDEEFLSRQGDAFRFAQGQTFVGVTVNRRHWRDLLQFNQQHLQTDIARVQNVLHTFEYFQHTWVKVVVRVRNETQFHGKDYASSGCVSSSVSSVFFDAFAAFFSAADSRNWEYFMAATKRAENKPALNKVLRKNSHVPGQLAVPVVNAASQLLNE